MRSSLGEGRLRQITSPYGVGGETDYTAQEDLKSVNSYNRGEGRTLRVWFFHSCIPRPSLVLSALSILGSPHISSFMGLSDKLLLDRRDGRPRAGPGAQKSLAAEVHMANEQMAQTINVQWAAVLHDPLHTQMSFIPYLVRLPNHLAWRRKPHVLKTERSEVFISWEKTFQFACEIHLETTVKRHNLNSEAKLKARKML